MLCRSDLNSALESSISTRALPETLLRCTNICCRSSTPTSSTSRRRGLLQTTAVSSTTTAAPASTGAIVASTQAVVQYQVSRALGLT